MTFADIKKSHIILSLVVICALGFFLRFYKLEARTLVGDEFFDLDAIYGYHITGQWQPWDFNKGEIEIDETLKEEARELRNERSWAYRWQVAQVLRWLPLSEASARSVSIFWGAFSIILIYFAGKSFTKNKLIGLLAALMFALNISAIEMNRTLRMYAMLLPVYLIFVWLIFKFWEGKYAGKNSMLKKVQEKWNVNAFWLLPALLAGLLSLHLNQLSIAIVPAFVAYALLRAIMVIKERKTYWNKHTAALLMMAVVCLFVFFSGLLEKATTYTNTSVTTYVKFFRHNYNYFSLIGDNYLFFPLVVALSFFGIYWCFRKMNLKKEIIWISCSYFVPLLLAIFIWNYGAFDRFIFFIRSFEVILVTLGIYSVASFIQEKYFKEKPKMLACIVLVLALLVPNYLYFFQKENLYEKIPPRDELDYRLVFDYIGESGEKEDFLLTRNYRSFYFRDQNYRVHNFGGEFNPEKFTLNDLEKILEENDRGWVVIAERDEQFIKKDALKKMESDFEDLNLNGRFGEGLVYKWQK